MFENSSHEASIYEKVIFSDAARRALSGPIKPRDLLIVSVAYAGIMAVKALACSRSSVLIVDEESTNNPDISSVNPTSTKRDELSTLLASVRNSVELGAIQSVIGFPVATLDGSLEDAVSSAQAYILKVVDGLEKAGDVAAATAALDFSIKRISSALQEIRSV